MNRLAQATSLYLQQHADNPVDWWQWGEAALDEARKTNKPILLSIGYSACHWCHVMAHESFENESIAALMNAHFINIKVDREERPDIDQIYMTALHMMGQQGGWPLTMFLTPDARPFWGGTYFPPEQRYGRAGFPDILIQVSKLHTDQDDRVLKNAAALTNAIQGQNQATPEAIPESLSDQTAQSLLQASDPINGGIGHAPKFPNPSILEFLWRHHRNDLPHTGDHVIHTLERISAGGIYDHIGGGYCRYSVDERWLVPHFEKMLYDNAQLLTCLARAHAETGAQTFRTRIDETVAWLEREMRLENGCYAASLDADSEGEEGKFYVWTIDEVTELLDDTSKAFCAAYDVTESGNFEGKNIPNQLHLTAQDIDSESFSNEKQILLKARDQRIRPGRDDKQLTDWNALAVIGLIDAATATGNTDYLLRAKDIFTQLTKGDLADLPHSTSSAGFIRPAMASDYTNLTAAAIRLYKATREQAYIATATALISHLDTHYARKEQAGYFLSTDTATDVLARMSQSNDDAVPNHNAVMATAFADMATITGDQAWSKRADDLIQAYGSQILQSPANHCGMFAAKDAINNPVHVRISGPAGPATEALISAASNAAEPNLVTDYNRDDSKTPAAIVCVGQTCSLPLSDPEDLAQAIATRNRITST